MKTITATMTTKRHPDGSWKAVYARSCAGNVQILSETSCTQGAACIQLARRMHPGARAYGFEPVDEHMAAVAIVFSGRGAK
jgi:hypothetical protein